MTKEAVAADPASDAHRPAAHAQGGGTEDLDTLLDRVSGKVEAPRDDVPSGPAKPTKKGLDRGDVEKAMDGVRAAIMKCREVEQFEGTVTIRFVVAPSGDVRSAEATGPKKGTPTGDCVAAAVKRARFPAFDGAPTSFTSPFLLAE
jgi:hypothetical protein